LARAAGQFQITDFRLLSFAELQVALGVKAVSLNGLSIHCGTLPLDETRAISRNDSEPIDCIHRLDAVLVRTMPLGSLESVIFRMDCLQAIEAAGIRVINPPRSLEVAIDKWLTLHRLHLAGVPTPPTVTCQTRDAAMSAFEELGGDVLVKPIFGGEGRGIVRVQDIDTAWRVFSTFQQIGQILYVQQFLDHVGYDVRVLRIGNKTFCIKRYARDGHWRTNLTQGGHAEPHEITDFQLELAEKCAAAVGGSVLGIDLLPLRDGRLVALEVNAVPGWKGLAKSLNLDIGSEIIRHTLDSVQEKFTGPQPESAAVSQSHAK
jgi:ribosomal protein S6--L-glutamate ligase